MSADGRHDLLFDSARFNLSRVGAHFVNPCCFGEDAAAWLRERLAARGVDAGPPFQEDWGWALGATPAGATYLVGVGGTAADPPDPADPDRGEWRVILERRRSLRDRLAGRGRMTTDDPLLALVRDVLAREPDVHDLRDDA